jgi:hypothetical protein
MKTLHRLLIVALLLLLLATLGGKLLLGQTPVPRANPAGAARQGARESRELRVIVSLDRCRLWVVKDSADTLLSTKVAVGSGGTLRYSGRSWFFETPPGIRTVLSKEIDPVWIRPDWGYVEVAKRLHLRVDSVTARRPHRFEDGTSLVVRGNSVGILSDSVFEALDPEYEIIFDGVLYVPPIGTENRAVRGTLGKFRLNLGDGIGLHGTRETATIGQPVTHGCLRLGDNELAWVFAHIPIGTKVYIY